MNDLIDKCAYALQSNNFEVYLAENAQDTHRIFFDTILKKLNPSVISYGDSQTLFKTGILETLRLNKDVNLIETIEDNIPWREIINRRKKALLSDLYLTGTNAITLCGKLINMDMIGNRTSAISFGPRTVVIFAGKNKLVDDIPAAIKRIKNHAAPLNAKRHSMKTPCVKTGKCMDCSSPERICNILSIQQKCYPKGRIKIVLINEDLGL